MAASSGAFWDHLWIVGLCSIFLLLLVFPPGVAARIPLPKGTEDVRDLFASAPLVFHGRVLNVESREHRSIEEDVKHFDWDARNNQARIATFQVDRWYKGSSQLSTVKLQFDYGADAINGHDCIDLRQNTTWLVMARQRGDGVLEFSDDCEGGRPASSILSPYSSEAGVRQLQRDLIAGLQDLSWPIVQLGGVRRSLAQVIAKAERNKAFREGSYGALRCVAIDGWEPFASYDRHCPQCLVRHLKVKRAGGEVEEVKQYYHRYVVAMLLGPVLDVVLAIEPVLNEEAHSSAAPGAASIADGNTKVALPPAVPDVAKPAELVSNLSVPAAAPKALEMDASESVLPQRRPSMWAQKAERFAGSRSR